MAIDLKRLRNIAALGLEVAIILRVEVVREYLVVERLRCVFTNRLPYREATVEPAALRGCFHILLVAPACARIEIWCVCAVGKLEGECTALVYVCTAHHFFFLLYNYNCTYPAACTYLDF